MRQVTLRKFEIIFAIASVLSFFVSQQLLASPADAPTSVSFLGKWKLNVDKSPGIGIKSELITIESDGKNFKITYDRVFENGTTFGCSMVTRMKGDVVRPIETNGEPMKVEFRVTRKAPGAFVLNRRRVFTPAMNLKPALMAKR